MIAIPHILFCESPIENNKVDPDFEEEYAAAKRDGFGVLFYNYDNFTIDNIISKIKPANTITNTIYRGWMLTVQQYTELYNQLLSKNYRLINTPLQYKNCHYLPDSLRFIEEYTPRTIYQEYNGETSIDYLIEKTKIFNGSPVIIKDYVKSEKHNWDTACFVKDSSDVKALKQTIHNFIALRDKYLNVGIVVREFLPLKHLTIHSKSGMPLTEEYRLFFYQHELLGVFDYWEEGNYIPERPDTTVFEEIAKQIDSVFFSMDIALQKNGEYIIIELGDGQVAGLPDRLNRTLFYNALNNLLS